LSLLAWLIHHVNRRGQP